MNAQERAVLEEFLDQLVQVRGIRKVPQADLMIRRALAHQPDAAYLLVQRALMLQQALEQAKARIAELEETDRSFFDSGPSSGAVAMPPAMSSRGASVATPAVRVSGPSQGFARQSPGEPTPEPSRGSGAAGSFLGQAAATAAGVAGGAFLFQGIEDLLGHAAPLAGHAPTPAAFPEDVTVNNYSASEAPHDEGHGEHSDQFADADESSDDDSDSGSDGGDFV